MLVFVLLLLFVSTLAATDPPPNVVIVFADDLGYGDVGVYGARGYSTPHLDKMAAEGIRLTDFHVAASLCSPSRAALMTGSYPMRVSIPNVLFPHHEVGLNPEETTIAEVLKARGYATAIFGKWHLGHRRMFLPTNHGFDEYLGIPYSNDMSPWPWNNRTPRMSSYPNLPLVKDLAVIEYEPDQAGLSRLYAENAVRFIKEHKDEPFFVYLPHTMPHVPLYVTQAFMGKTENGLYGDVVAEIDWSVGEIERALGEVGVANRTLVIFTSDNGPSLGGGAMLDPAHGGSAGPLREGKGTTFEGGMRVPFIARWPGKIPAGKVCGELASAMDLLPTLAGLASAELPERKIDGKDIWPLLTGEPGAKSPHEVLYHYRGEGLEAVRSGKWKLHLPHGYRNINGQKMEYGKRYPQARIELSLFDLEADLGERTNVADQHPDVVRKLLGYAEQARAELGDSLTKRKGSEVRPPGRTSRRVRRKFVPRGR